MTISLNSHEADSVKVEVPKVWFFPKTRMKRAITKAGYTLNPIRSNTGKVMMIRVYKDNNEVGVYCSEYTSSYGRPERGYYPNFRTNDETLKQIVAPYSNVRDR